MFIKTAILAALASLSLANSAPEAQSGAEASQLEARATVNGAVLLYSQANYGGESVPIFVIPESPAYCTQFQPVIRGGLSPKSFIASSAVLILWKNANCEGKDVFIINVSSSPSGPLSGVVANAAKVENGLEES